MIEDMELVSKLESLASESAKRLGLSYRGIRACHLDRDVHGNHMIGGNVEVSYEKGVPTFKIDLQKVEDMAPDILEAVVQHEMCHCKDFEEGLYSREVFVMGDRPEENKFLPLVIELDKSYSDYLCCKREIEVFGEDSFRTQHFYGLKEFLNYMNANIALTRQMFMATNNKELNDQVYSFIFSLFKEYIKSGLIGYKSKLMKDSIIEVSELLRQSFDVINDIPDDWITKTRFLFYTGMVMNVYINLSNSYFQNDIVRNTHSENGQVCKTLARKIGLTGFDATGAIKDLFSRK